MMVNNFEYDGLLLSDFGYVMCSFDSNGDEIITNGSNITFNTSPVLKGSKHILTSVKYEECLTTSFQICKDTCNVLEQGDMYISVDELATLTRWLNRKEFLKFKLKKEGYEIIYFEGSFNVSKIMWGEYIIGLELTLTTNRPFALYEPIKKIFRITKNNQIEIFKDISDEIGFIYPKTVITCNESGTLKIHNSIENRDTIIKNCVVGEVITMEYPVITSSIPSHNISDDFNFNFFRVANTYRENCNKLTFSLPCTMKIEYQPIRKVGV